MKQQFTAVLVLAFLNIIGFETYGQVSNFNNWDFESPAEDGRLSNGWRVWGRYEAAVDSTGYQSGQSGKITANAAGTSFGSIAYKIPYSYQGDTLHLEAFMKIEGVENGYAGLLLRIDGQGATLLMDNMSRQQIQGTRDWQRYAIKLPYPEEADAIYIGGILAGRGQAWFDNFRLRLDQRDIRSLEPVEKPKFPAQNDHEFDEDSKVQLPELTPKVVHDLALLGRIWGLVKYHHPIVAQGELNWDYELFRIMPEILACSTSAARDSSLLEWINRMGAIPPCEDCRPAQPDALLSPDLDWIKDGGLSTALRQKLQQVQQHRHQGSHYYVRPASGAGNPEFLHEDSYAQQPYPDPGYRLLALFRYWNIIAYYFPYKDLLETEWDAVLEESIKDFATAERELAYELAVLKLVARVKDSHANLWGGGDKIQNWKGHYYPAFHLRMVEGQLVVDDYYNPELKGETGLEVGSVITAINGRSVAACIDSLAPFYPASNAASQGRDMAPEMLRCTDPSVRISYRYQQEEQTRQLPLYHRDSLHLYQWYPRDTGQCYTMLDHEIGYINLQHIRDEDIPDIKANLKNARGIIIDQRNYPGSFVPFKLGSWFVNTPTAFAAFSRCNFKRPGEFALTDSVVLQPEGTTYSGQVVVLVNELTQSQAEYTAMAFRAGPNTTIAGSTTAGADGNVSRIALPGGLRTAISGIGIYYPDGTPTQRIGIVPDNIVKASVAGIRQGRDELLEWAVEFIENH